MHSQRLLSVAHDLDGLPAHARLPPSLPFPPCPAPPPTPSSPPSPPQHTPPPTPHPHLQVVFHLQTRSPAVLPPLCHLFGVAPDAARPLQGGASPDWHLLSVSASHAGTGPLGRTCPGHAAGCAGCRASRGPMPPCQLSVRPCTGPAHARPVQGARPAPHAAGPEQRPRLVSSRGSKQPALLPPGSPPAGCLRAPVPDGPAGRALTRRRQQRDAAGAAGLLLRAVRRWLSRPPCLGCAASQAGLPRTVALFHSRSSTAPSAGSPAASVRTQRARARLALPLGSSATRQELCRSLLASGPCLPFPPGAGLLRSGWALQKGSDAAALRRCGDLPECCVLRRSGCVPASGRAPASAAVAAQAHAHVRSAGAAFGCSATRP